MIRKLVKGVLWGVGIVLFGFLIFLIALFVEWGRSSASREHDKVFQQIASPDGRLIAEFHRATTAMWGGPDTVYVTIRKATNAWGDKVYSKTHECDDLSVFGIEWSNPRQLTVKYGECHESKFDNPTEFEQENKVSKRDSVWNDITIRYVDSYRVATH